MGDLLLAIKQDTDRNPIPKLGPMGGEMQAIQPGGFVDQPMQMQRMSGFRM